MSLLENGEQRYIKTINNIIIIRGGDSSVVRAPNSWLKGRGFESLLERRENFSSPGSTFCADSYFGNPFHPRVTTVARKKSRSFCQKCRWQVTAKHACTLRIEPCFGIGHNLSLICQMTSEDIKHQLNNNNIIIKNNNKAMSPIYRAADPSRGDANWSAGKNLALFIVMIYYYVCYIALVCIMWALRASMSAWYMYIIITIIILLLLLLPPETCFCRGFLSKIKANIFALIFERNPLQKHVKWGFKKSFTFFFLQLIIMWWNRFPSANPNAAFRSTLE